jgi:hypothetical protein
MKVLFALCAESATVDRTTNRVSLFNVFDHYLPPTFPASLPSVAFVAAVERDEGEGDVNGIAEICVPGAPQFNYPVSIVFTESRIARCMLTVQAIPVKQEGRITFRLVLPNGASGEASFMVANGATPPKGTVAAATAQRDA